MRCPPAGRGAPAIPWVAASSCSIAVDRPFALDGGSTLRDIDLAYETWGSLDATASNAVLVCHALTGDSHASGPSGPGHPSSGLVGGAHRAGSPARHRPVLPGVRQRAGRLPGLDRTGLDRPGHRCALRLAVPGGDHPRHGAHPGGGGRPPGHRPVDGGGGRVDGRDAGARVGDHLPAPHPGGGRHRHHRGGQRPADRVERDRAQRRDPGPGVAGRRLLRRRPGRGPPPRAWPWRASWRRSPTAPPRCSTRSSGGAGSTPWTTASPCGSASTSRATSTTRAPSWSAGSTPTRTWSSTGPWTSTTWAEGVAGSSRRCAGWWPRA